MTFDAIDITRTASVVTDAATAAVDATITTLMTTTGTETSLMEMVVCCFIARPFEHAAKNTHTPTTLNNPNNHDLKKKSRTLSDALAKVCTANQQVKSGGSGGGGGGGVIQRIMSWMTTSNQSERTSVDSNMPQTIQKNISNEHNRQEQTQTPSFCDCKIKESMQALEIQAVEHSYENRMKARRALATCVQTVKDLRIDVELKDCDGHVQTFESMDVVKFRDIVAPDAPMNHAITLAFAELCSRKYGS